MKNLTLNLLALCFITNLMSQSPKWIVAKSFVTGSSENNIGFDNLKFYELSFEGNEIQSKSRKLGNSITSIASQGVGEGLASACDESGDIAFYCFFNVKDGYAASLIDDLYFVAKNNETGKDEVFHKTIAEGIGSNSSRNIVILKDDFKKGIYHVFYKTSAVNDRPENIIYRMEVDLNSKSISNKTKVDENRLNEGFAISRKDCAGNRWFLYTKYFGNRTELYGSKYNQNGWSNPILMKSIDHEFIQSGGQGDLELSHDGKTLAYNLINFSNATQDIFIFDFDSTNGECTNERIVDNTFGPVSSLEFSPDNKRLFITQGGASGFTTEMYNFPVPTENYLVNLNDNCKYPGKIGFNIEISSNNLLIFNTGNHNVFLPFITNPNASPGSFIFNKTKNFDGGNGVHSYLPDQIDGDLIIEEVKEFKLSLPDSICYKDSLLLYIDIPSNYILRWFKNNEYLGNKNSIFTKINENSTIIAELIKPDGCQVRVMKLIKVVDYFNPDFDINLDSCDQVFKIQKKINGGKISLLNADSLFIKNLNDLEFQLDSGSYLIKHEVGKAQCKSTLYKDVNFDPNIEEKNQVIFPNIFSPGRNGINNKICFDQLPISELGFSIEIYDRWGNLVFKSISKNDCWDGTFNGKLCEEDVYVYLLKYKLDKCNDETRVKKGDLTILR